MAKIERMTVLNLRHHWRRREESFSLTVMTANVNFIKAYFITKRRGKISWSVCPLQAHYLVKPTKAKILTTL
jgi:hypothetical protein